MICSEGDVCGSSAVVEGNISKKLLFFVVRVLFFKNFCCFLWGNVFSDLLKFFAGGFSEVSFVWVRGPKSSNIVFFPG